MPVVVIGGVNMGYQSLRNAGLIPAALLPAQAQPAETAAACDEKATAVARDLVAGAVPGDRAMAQGALDCLDDAKFKLAVLAARKPGQRTVRFSP